MLVNKANYRGYRLTTKFVVFARITEVSLMSRKTALWVLLKLEILLATHTRCRMDILT